MTPLRLVDLLSVAFVFGATTWFFFVQSPVLLRRLGREQFVPVQMRLTVVLFQALSLAVLLSAGLSALHSPLASAAMATAALAATGALVNQLFVVPRALRAGGRSRPEIKGKDHEAGTAAFAAHGAGDATRLMHRMVVLFVVVMLVGAVGHVAVLLRS